MKQMNATEIFQQFDASAAGGIESGLSFLQQQFRGSGQYHRLFDVLKMQIRHDLGLSLFHQSSDDPLDKETQRQLEDRFLGACREIARLYFEQGDLNDGWMYLQPICDDPIAKELIESVVVSDENFQSVIEIAFNHNVSPAYGYGLLLDRCGTCDGITAFDVQAHQFDRETVSQLAAILLNHFYGELRANVADHVSRTEGSVDESAGLTELLANRDWLLAEGGQHADATHLASVVRIARQTTDHAERERALALADYGSRLPQDFQFQGDPPFEDTYHDHRIWFSALLGTEVESAIEHFSDKAEQAKGQPEELMIAEALVDLQIQTGARDAAVQTTIERILPNLDPHELPAAAFEIAASPDQYKTLASGFRRCENFSAYAFAVLCQQEQAGSESAVDPL